MNRHTENGSTDPQRPRVALVAHDNKKPALLEWAESHIQELAGCELWATGTTGGMLIDELGLKGTREGGARVSEVHGNFLVNERSASAEEMLALIERVKNAAMESRGIKLETEVQIVGEQKGLYA